MTIRMVEDYLCGTNVMTCLHKACKYNKMPNYFHEWPKRHSFETKFCTVTREPMMAIFAKDPIFADNCFPNDLVAC